MKLQLRTHYIFVEFVNNILKYGDHSNYMIVKYESGQLVLLKSQFSRLLKMYH